MRRANASSVGLGAIILGALALVVGLLVLHANPRIFATEKCVIADGGVTHSLGTAQANNAAIIAAQGLKRGFTSTGVTVALATAIQESGLRNLDYGDRDSVGLFQQRPSQGWGEPAALVNPHYSSWRFFDALGKVPGWEDMAVTEAAQAVQRSAFPDAYADHEDEARAWALALTGEGGGTVACDLGAATGTTSDAFAARIEEDFGPGVYAVDIAPTTDGTVVTVRGADASAARALFAWAVSVAGAESVAAVTLDTDAWTRDSEDPEDPQPGVVVVRLTPATAS